MIIPFETCLETFTLAMDPMGRVSEAFDDESNIWRPRLCRNLNDWESEEFGNLLALLEGFKPNISKRDCWEWVISKKRVFTPQFLYLELGGFRVVSFLINGIWIPGIPSKVSFFMWNTFLD